MCAIVHCCLSATPLQPYLAPPPPPTARPPMMRRYSVVAVPRLGAPLFKISIPGIASAVAAGARLVFVASPNNPTGALLSDEEIEALCSLEAIIVVDEAYIEFAGLHRSATRFLERFPNLVVMRTFSKWAGLAGLRVGYMVGHPKLVERAKAIKQPYNVTVLSDIGAQAAIKVCACICMQCMFWVAIWEVRGMNGAAAGETPAATQMAAVLLRRCLLAADYCRHRLVSSSLFSVLSTQCCLVVFAAFVRCPVPVQDLLHPSECHGAGA
jgi:hypothetical protein